MRFSSLLMIAALAGCAETHYIYTPETANAVSHDLPASRVAIPQERPQGTVEVKSYGVTHLRNVANPVLHVRMVVTNDGDDVPWQVDTREQYVAIPAEGRSRAAYASSDAHTLPIVMIARRERHVFDLYFPLPDGMSAGQLPRFDLQWQVATPERLVASSTSFDRVRQDPDRYAYDPWWPYGGFGPYWWYDPFYPSVAFVHAHHWHGGHHR